MPSKKKKVACYLEEDVEQALAGFQTKNGVSGSEAVNLLIKSSLIEKEDTPEGLVIQSDIENRLNVIESRLDQGCRISVCNAEKLEKIERELCCVEDSLERAERATPSENWVGIGVQLAKG
jgi:hypothetical protein